MFALASRPWLIIGANELFNFILRFIAKFATFSIDSSNFKFGLDLSYNRYINHKKNAYSDRVLSKF